MAMVPLEELPSKTSRCTLVAAGVPCEELPGERRGGTTDGLDAASGVAPPTSDWLVSDVVVSAAPPAEPAASSCERAAAEISLIRATPRVAGAAERITLVEFVLPFSALSSLTEELVKDAVSGVADEAVEAAIATRNAQGSRGNGRARAGGDLYG